MPNRHTVKKTWHFDRSKGKGKYYYEHDDRIVEARSVSFKSNRRSKKHKIRDWELAVRAHLENEDADIPGPSGGRQSSRQTGRHNSSGNMSKSRRHNKNSSKTVQHSKKHDKDASWYKISIPHGSRYSKEYVLKTLFNYVSPHVFIPLSYEVRGTEASFYVEDKESALTLAACDKKITTDLGFKMIIRMRPAVPCVQVNLVLKEKMKRVMVKRYNTSLKVLNMSAFHRDPELTDSMVVLSRTCVLITMIEIIIENIPELEALDLSDNKLHTLANFPHFIEKVPNLKFLHLGKNRIRDMNQLDYLQGMKLQDLVLNRNPVCDKFQDKNLYVSEVRKRFPKIMRLDGVDLPPPIGFDVVEEFKMPTSKLSFMCSPESMVIARQFLEQYFQIYDSDNREPLVDAYHNDAMFSISSTYPPGQSSTNGIALSCYIQESRNILRVKDTIRRHKLLHKGKLSIVSCLSQLPKSRHDPMSFAVELVLCTSQILVLSVSGLFMEPTSLKLTLIRSFSRVFVIIPVGQGFCITNEELYITNATEEQSESAFKTPAPAPLLPQVMPSNSMPVIPHIDDNSKLQMVEIFALQSGMNIPWARKCLDETNWDLQRATIVFTELHRQGTIPAEAFIK